MKRLHCLTAGLALAVLSGCASYDYVGGGAPGGYYSGRVVHDYYGPSIGIYGNYGSGYYGYGNYPGYGYWGNYPYYRPPYVTYPRPPYRPERPDRPDRPGRPDGGHGSNHGGDRPPPWRDPTQGAWRESGQVKLPPRTQSPSRVTPTTPMRPQQATTGPRPQNGRSEGRPGWRGASSTPRTSSPRVQERQVEP